MSKITNTSSLTSHYVLPDGNKISSSATSNTSSTENMTTSFTKVRATEKQYVSPSETVKQTLTLNNTSEFTITNINIKDIISANATFKAGSLMVDNVAYENLDPVAGFDLPKDISANSTVVITYEIKVDDMVETDTINIVSQIKYSVNEVEDLSENSNVVNLDIIQANISITKSATPNVVIKGQIVTFKNVIENKGGTSNTDVVFTDKLPNEVEFVEGSIKIDGVEKADLTLENGISLEDLTPGKTITVEFQAKVN